MPPRRKEAGSLTNSQRFKEEKKQQQANSIGTRAQAIAEAAGAVLSKGGSNPTRQASANGLNTAAIQVSRPGGLTSGLSGTSLSSLGNVGGFSGQFASAQIQPTTDIYGGITLPQYDFVGMVPTDLLNPQIQLQATQEQLNQGLEIYAAGTRAQHLLQAGFKYIEEVGKTKQQFHKAQSSVIKAATEEIKVNQNIVEFDTQNVELAIKGEKLNQASERLRQEQVKTVAAQNETSQLILKIQATEGKRDAEIQRINAQTNDIIQKYLSDSIRGAA